MSYGNQRSRGRQQSQSNAPSDYSERTDNFTPSHSSYNGGGGGSRYYNDGVGNTLDGSDKTPYSYSQSYYYDCEGSNALDGSGRSDRTPYSQQFSYYESGNQLDYSDSDRTPYSHGQSYQSQSYQSRDYYDDGFNYGSNNSGHQHSEMYSARSYGNDNMSQATPTSYSHQSRQSNQRSQNGNASVGGGSTYATTVANGGRGRCPYQIGFSVQNTGKQMSTTKRIIHFRFGFANAQAMSQGRAGVDCRGQEHDLFVTWSITGGKREICLDGREIQYSAGKRANSSRRADILEAAWKMSDHIFELKCYAYKSEKHNPRWRQYNLTIDGRSFFELPEIFDLGLKGLGTRTLPSTISGSSGWDQTTTSSTTGVSSSKGSLHTDQSSVKSSIQSRIEEQRRLMTRKKQGPSRHAYNGSVTSGVTFNSDASSSNLISFTGLNKSDDQDDSGVYSSGVFSVEPSELKEARNRQRASGEQTIASENHQQSASTLRSYQPKYSPTVSSSSTNIVASQTQKQYSPQQRDNSEQQLTTDMTLATQQPPTYEEITEALVPLNLSTGLQPKALPPLDDQQISIDHARNSQYRGQTISNPDKLPKSVNKFAFF